MIRKALNELIEWNNRKRRKPLIVWGARQVGKTYLIRDIFAEEYYPKRYIYLDFKEEDELKEFCNKTVNPSKIIEYISILKNKPINDDTLLIFDEIQECKNIISSLKYFCQEYPTLHVIATGSMVRIKIQRENKKRGVKTDDQFLFPVGKIDEITLFPMTFDEFLMNSNSALYNKLKESYYSGKREIEESIHLLALDYLYRYLLIGGMPEPVSAYIEDKDLLETKRLLSSLYNNYLADMELYQASPESVIRSRALFKNIYRELNRESKNFSPGLIEDKAKNRDFASPIQWLTFAYVVHQSLMLPEHITIPLTPSKEKTFRLYLGDIGMFSFQSGINAVSFISNEKENTLSGIFFENFVADELKAQSIPLYYWKGKAFSEMEFVVESDNKIYPIDVKRGRGNLNSLTAFSNHNKFEMAIKISKNHYGVDKERKIVTIPFYYVSFLAEDLNKGVFTY